MTQASPTSSVRSPSLTVAGGNAAGGTYSLGGGTLAVTTINLTGNSTNGGTLRWTSGSIVPYVTGGQATMNLNTKASLSLEGNGTYSLNGTVNLQGGSVNVPSTYEATLGGILSGGMLTKTGTGTLVLSNGNTYSGDTVVSAGTLVASGGTSIPNSSVVSVAGGATLRVDSPQTIGSFSGAGTVQLNSSLTADGAAAAFAGTIAGAGQLIKTGPGTLDLSNAVNTSSGGTRVNAGVIRFSAPGNLGSGPVTMAGGTLKWAGTTTADPTAHGFSLSSGTNSTLDIGANNVTISSNEITGSGNLTKVGSGDLRLNWPNFEFYGATTIGAGGTLTLGIDSALYNAKLVYSSTGGSLRFDALSSEYILGSLAGDKSLALADISGQPVTLIAGFNNASTTYSGVLSGPGTFQKHGSGTMTLTGSNTHSGQTQVVYGTLSVSSPSNLGDGSPTNTLHLDGGTLLTTADMTIARNATLGYYLGTIDTGGHTVTYSGAISETGIYGPGSFAKSGAGTLVVSGTNTYSGSTTVGGGTLTASGGNAIPNSSAVSIASGATLSLAGSETIGTLAGAGNVVLGSYTLTTDGTAVNPFSGTLSGSGSLTKVGTGTLVLTGANTYTGATTISQGVLQIGTGGSVAGNITDNASLIISRSDTSTYSGIVSGTGSLTKAGTGTLVLTGANAYTGGTTISAGTLQVGDGGTTGSVTGNVLDNARLVVNNSGSASLSGIISGSGSLTKLGTGNLTLSGANTYSGGTTISAGTLTLGGVGGGSRLGAGPVVNNGTLVFGVAVGGFTFAGDISGSGSLTTPTVGTGGTLVLSGHNTFTGGTTINRGTIRFNSADSVGGSGSTITLGGTGSVVLGYAIDPDFVGRLTSGSYGTISLTTNSANNLNFGSLSDVKLAALGNVTLSGTITPPTSTHKLSLSGGAAGSSLTVSSAGIGSATSLALSGVVKVTGTSAIPLPTPFDTLVLDPGAGNSIALNAPSNGGTQYTGTIQVDSGTAVIYGYTTYYPPSFVKTGPGTLDMPDYFQGGDVTVSAGTLSVEGTYWAGTLHSAATVMSQWLTAADLGDYTQSGAGTLVVDLASATLGGSSGGGYDTFGGRSASLAGTLDVNLVNGFVPSDGDSFQILAFTTVSGTFTTYDLPDLSGSGLDWDISSLYTDGIISVVAVSPSFAPVPEPAGLGVLMTGAMALGARRRRR